MDIYIPSKGRPSGKTFKLLAGINYKVVIEPQDFDLYTNNGHSFENIIVLPKNNMGISYVRNFIKKLYKGELLMMIDDDIIKFDILDQSIGRLTNNSNRKPVIEYLSLLEFEAQDLKFDIATLGMRQFVWSSKKPYVYDCFCGTITLINSKTNIWFDETLKCKEDMDFTLKNIYADKIVMRFNCFAYDHTMASGDAGGFSDFYKAKEDQKYNEIMVQRYPNNCSIVEKFGRLDLKIKYKKIS